MEQNRYLKLLPIFLCGMIVVFSVFFLLQPKKEFSVNENRYLQSFPKFSFSSLEKGTFTEQLKNYTTDQFPARDTFMALKTKTDQWLGKKEENNVFFGKDGYLLENYATPKNTSHIIEVLNSFYQKVNDVNMSLLLAPTSIVINQDLLPKNAPAKDSLKTMEEIYQKLNFNTIPVVAALKKGNQEYQMYYRLDHHWTTFGAYYAYLEYCQLNDLIPLSINDFELEKVTDQFKGTLYSKTNDYSLKADSIYLFQKNSHLKVNYVLSKRVTNTLYERSYLEKKDKYSIFLDNNHPLIEITNQDLKNGKEILVIKDSYANSFVPFLTNHYEKVHVIDPRFYKFAISDYIKAHSNIKDVLLLYNMNTLDGDLGITSIR